MLLTRKRRAKPGAAPGTIVSEGAPARETKITVMSYSAEELEEKEAESVDGCFGYVGKREVTWIDVDGTQDAEMLRQIGDKFGIHSLALEDVINGGQRPKLEDFGEYLFITLRLPRKREAGASVDTEQINIFLGSSFVMTIHDSSDAFEPIIQRIREDKGRIRKMKSGYLAYALIDLLVDQHFPIMELIAGQIEELEDEVQENPSPEIVRKIRDIKRDLILIRSSIWPMREVINAMEREEPELISDEAKLFLRDVYDHTIQIADIVESYRDILSEMFNVYLSVKADNTNEIMKVLTIFAAIFIPLTFIAGIYGTNFDFVPELKWRYSYFVMLGLMVLITAAMLRFFRKRGWLGGKQK
jgi:magnesium transporter